MALRVRWVGEKVLTGRLLRMPKKLRDEVGAQLLLHQMYIYDASQNLVPVDTGALKLSGQMGPLKGGTRGNHLEVAVGYGSPYILNERSGIPTARYAGYQHELRGRKYLEHALLQQEGSFLRGMRTAINRATRF